MRKVWEDRAWDEYLYWIDHDRKVVKRINRLIKSIERSIEDPDTMGSIGKQEKLKRSKCGLMSVRIDEKNRIVYKIEGETLVILACRGHYE